jgi:hypothetical protein
MVALAQVPEAGRRAVERDLLAALAIFAIVVASTFPVVLPFVFFRGCRIGRSWCRA